MTTLQNNTTRKDRLLEIINRSFKQWERFFNKNMFSEDERIEMLEEFLKVNNLTLEEYELQLLEDPRYALNHEKRMYEMAPGVTVTFAQMKELPQILARALMLKSLARLFGMTQEQFDDDRKKRPNNATMKHVSEATPETVLMDYLDNWVKKKKKPLPPVRPDVDPWEIEALNRIEQALKKLDKSPKQAILALHTGEDELLYDYVTGKALSKEGREKYMRSVSELRTAMWVAILSDEGGDACIAENMKKSGILAVDIDRVEGENIIIELLAQNIITEIEVMRSL